jgi:methyl-accepting chemotaxis protein
MFAQARIATRLGFGFGLLILLLLVTGIFALTRLDMLADLTGKLYRHPYTVRSAVLELNVQMLEIHRDLADALIAPDRKHINAARGRISESHADIEAHFRIVAERFLGDPMLYVKPREAFDEWVPVCEEILTMLERGEQDRALALHWGQSAKQVALISAQMDALTAFARGKANEFMGGAEETREQTYALTTALITAAILIGAFFALIISRSITTPLGAITQAASRIARGDVEQYIEHQSKSEIGQLSAAFRELITYIKGIAQAAEQLAQGSLAIELQPRSDQDILSYNFQHMADNLRQLFSQLNLQADELAQSSSKLSTVSQQVAGNISSVSTNATTAAAAAEQMSANMTSISASAEQSAGSINTVATSTEEMSSTVAEIARNAEKARGVTSSAVTTVDNATQEVRQLEQSAQQIGKVIEVIVEIAEQTKLLALNATIEAASAGEMGKGFAVVAGEVKELARQTNEATSEIRGQIEAIQASMGGTVEQIGQIQQVIQSVNELVTQIAAAVEQQAVTTRSMAQNISQAAQGVQVVTTSVGAAAEASHSIAAEISGVNAASQDVNVAVAEVNAQAEELSNLGADLKEMVEMFTPNGQS